MIKLKYYSLSKEEKIKVKEEFYKTDYGKMIKTRLDRVFIIGIISLLFGLFLIITNKQIWDIISGISLLLVSLFFMIGSMKVRRDKINNYLVKKKK